MQLSAGEDAQLKDRNSMRSEVSNDTRITAIQVGAPSHSAILQVFFPPVLTSSLEVITSAHYFSSEMVCSC